jgi:hypothetical protein
MILEKINELESLGQELQIEDTEKRAGFESRAKTYDQLQ